MDKSKVKKEKRVRRHNRIRAKIKGTKDVPRLSVFKSNKSIYAQIIDDVNGLTIASCSLGEVKGKTGLEKAELMGEELAKRAGEKKVKKIVFDRGGYIYTGKIKALADGARKGGLKF